ncbi:MAG: hypothetical protein JW810_14505 [Sedimentisphaerales bacterium]|nr:hypothetical protein [Sedimentisphaerales bacterium]
MKKKRDKDYEIVFHLQEAKIHLQGLVQDIEKGEIDPLEDVSAIEVSLWHVMEHLCLGWHLREHLMGEVELDDEKFGLLCSAIPNWNASFFLIDSSKKPQEDKNI